MQYILYIPNILEKALRKLLGLAIMLAEQWSILHWAAIFICHNVVKQSVQCLCKNCSSHILVPVRTPSRASLASPSPSSSTRSPLSSTFLARDVGRAFLRRDSASGRQQRRSAGARCHVPCPRCHVPGVLLTPDVQSRAAARALARPSPEPPPP